MEREKTISGRIKDKLRAGRKYLLPKVGKELFKTYKWQISPASTSSEKFT